MNFIGEKAIVKNNIARLDCICYACRKMKHDCSPVCIKWYNERREKSTRNTVTLCDSCYDFHDIHFKQVNNRYGGRVFSNVMDQLLEYRV